MSRLTDGVTDGVFRDLLFRDFRDVIMTAKRKAGAIDYTGSASDSFLEQEGTREDIEAVAVKRVIS